MSKIAPVHGSNSNSTKHDDTHPMKLFLPPLFAALLWIGPSYGQQPAPADNTKRNAAQQNHQTDTAEQQSNQKDDLALTQRIRQAVVKDPALSMNAKNVKIITRQGKVLLRGPVETPQEKASIAAKSGQIAGPGNVEDQLEVKAAQKETTGR
jgi:hyperosmotically inducible periplasmic protein